MAGEDTKKGEPVAVKADGTFKICYDGTILKFQLDRGQHSVRLVSVTPSRPSAEPAAAAHKAQAALLIKLSQEDLLRKLSQSKHVVFSDVIRTNEDLRRSLKPITKFSQEIAKGGQTKPVVVLRLRDNAGVNIKNAMRSIRSQEHALNAHIVRIRGSEKKG